jgi:hypothetical protein
LVQADVEGHALERGEHNENDEHDQVVVVECREHLLIDVLEDGHSHAVRALHPQHSIDEDALVDRVPESHQEQDRVASLRLGLGWYLHSQLETKHELTESFATEDAFLVHVGVHDCPDDTNQPENAAHEA